MIAYVWVHVGCLPQIHKHFCQQRDRIMNTKVCNANTCICVCTTLHGNRSHTHVQRHCMVVCAWFYLCDFMCLIVWQCAHDVMMMKTRSYTVSNGMSPNMIAFVSIHVGWHTWWGSGGLRSRCFFRFRRVPLQILVAVLEGSGADTWSASGGFLCRYLLRFVALVLVPLCSTIAWLYVYDCMTMCAWSHRENHMTTRGSNSVQSNMTPGKKWNKT